MPNLIQVFKNFSTNPVASMKIICAAGYPVCTLPLGFLCCIRLVEARPNAAKDVGIQVLPGQANAGEPKHKKFVPVEPGLTGLAVEELAGAGWHLHLLLHFFRRLVSRCFHVRLSKTSKSSAVEKKEHNETMRRL